MLCPQVGRQSPGSEEVHKCKHIHLSTGYAYLDLQGEIEMLECGVHNTRRQDASCFSTWLCVGTLGISTQIVINSICVKPRRKYLRGTETAVAHALVPLRTVNHALQVLHIKLPTEHTLPWGDQNPSKAIPVCETELPSCLL